MNDERQAATVLQRAHCSFPARKHKSGWFMCLVSKGKPQFGLTAIPHPENKDGGTKEQPKRSRKVGYDLHHGPLTYAGVRTERYPILAFV